MRIKIISIFFILAYIFSTSHLLGNNFDNVDQHARKISKSRNLKYLSEKLTSPYTDTLNKYRSIFTWIAHNISYDCKAFHNSSLAVYDPKDVISKGRTVCSGYSALFEELCKLSGLECVTISGWSKNNYALIGKKLREPDHDWNAIKVNGQWHLCDVTWAAGYTEGNCDKYVKKFEDFYFCSPPNLFSLQHYPLEPKWLLGVSITKDEFINLPHFYATSLAKNINLTTPLSSIKYRKNKNILIDFSVANIKEVIYVVASGEKKSIVEVANNPSGLYKIEFSLNKYAPYIFVYFGTEGAFVIKVDK
jgi:transglutaminase/protease-like cytokinesis protein 3